MSVDSASDKLSSDMLTFLSVRAWRRPLLIITVRERRLRLWLGRGAAG